MLKARVLLWSKLSNRGSTGVFQMSVTMHLLLVRNVAITTLAIVIDINMNSIHIQIQETPGCLLYLMDGHYPGLGRIYTRSVSVDSEEVAHHKISFLTNKTHVIIDQLVSCRSNPSFSSSSYHHFWKILILWSWASDRHPQTPCSRCGCALIFEFLIC